MKKIFLFIALVAISMSVNAQKAIQTSKFLDNTYVGVDFGVGTPLSLDNVFPLNPTATLRVGKNFCPIFGLEIEGTTWFGSHISTTPRYGWANRFDGTHHNVVRGLYVGANGTFNLSNLFMGYKGEPRFFEFGTVVGAGWLHGFIPDTKDNHNNHFGVKTGMDFSLNLGNDKEHTISIRPSVLWNLSQPGNSNEYLAFNKKGAQLHLSVGYVYHFMTSNGTHHFVVYDINAMNKKINNLRAELAKKPKEVKVVETVEKIVKETVTVNGPTYVLFAFDSAELDDNAKAALDNVSGKVKIVAYASPEGKEAHNKKLSQQRADAVSKYLKEKGVTVVSSEGCGVSGKSSNRIAIVTVE